MSAHHTTRKPALRKPALIAALVLAPLAGIGLPSPQLAAQSAPLVTSAETRAETAAEERARTHLARGYLLSTSGDYSAAGREFARVARIQRAAGTLPFEALWMRAQMYHVQGFPEQAGSTLSRLADAAAAAGNPALQARALLEAAVLYQRAHMPEQVQRHAAELDRLLASGRLDAQLRRSIEQRIIRA